MKEKLPPGVRCTKGRFYWSPTTRAERDARKAAGLPLSVPLGATADEARRAWAKLHEQAPPPREPAKPGTVGELLDRFESDVLLASKAAARGKTKARYADSTRESYGTSLRQLRAAFGAMRYARLPAQALDPGVLTTADVQHYLLSAPAPIAANRNIDCLSTVFAWAKRWRLSVVNPCEGAEHNEEEPRIRDVEPWEIEVLIAHSTWNFGLMIQVADLTGASGQDLRGLRREHVTAAGLLIRRGKTGSRRVTEWSPALRSLIDAALELGPPVRGAVFCNRKGEPYTKSGYQSQWRRIVARARAWCIENGLPPLPDVRMHDIRKKAGNDAADAGQQMHAFLGNTEAVSRKHYKTRPDRVKPTR